MFSLCFEFMRERPPLHRSLDTKIFFSRTTPPTLQFRSSRKNLELLNWSVGGVVRENKYIDVAHALISTALK